MPTPVNIARQCLSPESIQALDEAVIVANRRCHSQTSSLHVVKSLLSPPSSPLREACTRARNSAYASRIQFKALELCLGVSLDRLPTTPQRVDEPPVSNSLMAAIKRSQANQRRQPENFHMYQQMANVSAAVSPVIKVELQNLILSILDDPVVSRVFGESGFQSSDIKLSILRPVHRHLFRQPIFLCNLSNSNNFGFPFPGVLENNDVYKKINEVRKYKKKCNALLVGQSGSDTVKVYLETLEKTKVDNVVSVKDEVAKFVTGNSDVNLLDVKFKEVGDVAKKRVGCGVVVDYGDLDVLTKGESSLDLVKVVVKKLGELIVVYGGRVWLIGYAESYDVCARFFKMFPCVEEEWDLHVLPIDSIRPSMAETFPKSSLMESFVPFGGFFSMPSDIKSSLRISNYFGSLCHMCDKKFKLEVKAISNGGLSSSVSDHYPSTLPSWLQTSKLCSNTNMNMVQAQEDPDLVSAKIVGLQKKWQSICQRLHQNQPYMQMLPKATYTVGPRVPSVIGFQVTEHSSQNVLNHNTSSIESECNTISKSNTTKVKESAVVRSLSSSSEGSGNSVTTDLGLGANCSLTSLDQKNLKLMYSSLFTRVGRQEKALSIISQTIGQCRAQPRPNRGGIWFGFVGPDRVAKKRTAAALAEIMFGSKENMISVNLSSLDFMNGCDLKLRGKNVVDIIADELIKKQLSVVFLENVDMADTLTQHHISRAVSTGRFSDSHGREVSISNAIFVLTSKLFGVNETEDVSVDYTEENVLKSKCGSICMLVGLDLGNMKPSPQVVSVTRKRKLDCRIYLDLNLPAEESETDYDSAPENLNEWLEDFLDHVDEKVIFEAFDFDLLAEKVLKRIEDCFEKIVGLDCLLEIDYKLMEQILKASYFLETRKTEDWIEQVLGEAFEEAQRKYGLGSNSVLKLMVADQMLEVQPDGVLLPDRIIIT